MIVVLAFFLSAVAMDVAAIAWQEYRERGRAWTVAALSMLIEAMAIIPVWTAVQLDDWRIIAVSIIGSAVGALLGMRWRGRI